MGLVVDPKGTPCCSKLNNFGTQMLNLTNIMSYFYPGGLVLLILVELFSDPHGLSCCSSWTVLLILVLLANSSGTAHFS